MTALRIHRPTSLPPADRRLVRAYDTVAAWEDGDDPGRLVRAAAALLARGGPDALALARAAVTRAAELLAARPDPFALACEAAAAGADAERAVTRPALRRLLGEHLRERVTLYRRAFEAGRREMYRELLGMGQDYRDVPCTPNGNCRPRQPSGCRSGTGPPPTPAAAPV